MPQGLPALAESDVRDLATERSFNRGVGYYRSGAIFEPVRQGDELRAYCEGSDYEPYRVSVTLGRPGIITTRCTCPYDWGGICKHIVALLLTWIHQPEAFHTLAPLDETLADRSKQELIALIKEMLKREPDLIRLLELPVQPDRRMPLDLDAFRRQINYALRREFPDADVVATELAAIAETADRFLEAGDWANAGALYHLILNEIVPGYQNLYDENGDVNIVLQSCAEGLDACLGEGSASAATRRTWLEALLEAEFKDLDMGGIDLAYPADEVIIRHATDEEWSWIETRVREAIAARTETYSRWGREALVRFLARRLSYTGQEAQVDALIFELGSPEQRAFRLVHLGRFKEAVDIARQHFVDLPGLVIRFADALVEAGAGPMAEAYIISQLDTRSKVSYLSWLARRAEEQGDLEAAWDWWRQHFHETYHLETYQALRTVAGQLGTWKQMRQELLAQLEAEQKWPTLLSVALDEKDARRALELLPHVSRGWHAGNYELQVAQVAEADFPQAARDIYCRRAQRLIDARGRGNYQEAAKLLTRARDIYRRLDAMAEWDGYIADLRLRHSRLPALQDELNKARL